MKDSSKQQPDTPNAWDEYSRLLRQTAVHTNSTFEQVDTRIALREQRSVTMRWIGSAVAGVIVVCLVTWVGVVGSSEFDHLTTQQIDSTEKASTRPVSQNIGAKRRPRVPAPIGKMSLAADTLIPSRITVEVDETDMVAPGYFEASRQPREVTISAVTGTAPSRVLRPTK